MDKTFKPKKMTRKEWQDNRPLFLKGMGMGAALDGWQKSVVKADFEVGTFATIKKRLEDAIGAVGGVKMAILKAQKACKAQVTPQKNTSAALDNYMKVCDDMHKDLLAQHVFESKMDKLSLSHTVDGVLKDTKLNAALTAMIKVTRDQPFLETYQLVVKKKKIEEAVKKFGPGNDYNISSTANKTLKAKYIDKDATITDRRLKSAEKTLVEDSAKLMRGICSRLMTEEFGAGFVRKAHKI